MYIAFENDPNKNNRFKGTMFLICVAIFLIMCAATCEGQGYKATDIYKVINRTDSVSKLELLTSKKFHKKLNEYRKSKGACELRWSDTLYLMAMNHNEWMYKNKTHIIHYENTCSYNFTGESPKDRLDYVCEVKTFGASENCTSFWWKDGTMEEIAETGALFAFEMWKSDKPHDENMLCRTSKIHGVHFLYRPTGAYCTSDFYGLRLVKN